MKNSTTNLLFLLLFTFPALLKSQTLSVGIIGGTDNLKPILDWNSGIIKQDELKDSTQGTVFHFGVTGKLKVHERLFLRSDIFYRKTVSNFQAQYKVVDQLWTSTAKLEANTIQFLFAPQLHFFPRNFAYIYAGFLMEINTGSDFTYGILNYVDDQDVPQIKDFKDDEAENNSAPGVAVGIGIHPRFNKFGVFAEARYTRSKPTAVNKNLPRIGQENICLSAGFTYDIID